MIQNKHLIGCSLFEIAIEDHLRAILSTNMSQYDVTVTLKQRGKKIKIRFFRCLRQAKDTTRNNKTPTHDSNYCCEEPKKKLSFPV